MPAGMGQVGWARGHIQDEGLAAGRDVGRKFARYLLVAADQVRTECLVVLKRPQPVCLVPGVPAQGGQLAVPFGIRGFHGKLVSDMPGPVRWKTLVRNAPRLVFLLAGDYADPNAPGASAPFASGAILRRFRVFHGDRA